jgi:hypothetical protein
MSKCYHLMTRRTKDNKPKIYGEARTRNPYTVKLTSVCIGGHAMDIYRSDEHIAHEFDNFVVVCLPGHLAQICTRANALCLVCKETLDMPFWESIDTHPISPVHNTQLQIIDCV